MKRPHITNSFNPSVITFGLTDQLFYLFLFKVLILNRNSWHILCLRYHSSYEICLVVQHYGKLLDYHILWFCALFSKDGLLEWGEVTYMVFPLRLTTNLRSFWSCFQKSRIQIWFYYHTFFLANKISYTKYNKQLIFKICYKLWFSVVNHADDVLGIVQYVIIWLAFF